MVANSSGGPLAFRCCWSIVLLAIVCGGCENYNFPTEAPVNSGADNDDASKMAPTVPPPPPSGQRAPDSGDPPSAASVNGGQTAGELGTNRRPAERKTLPVTVGNGGDNDQFLPAADKPALPVNTSAVSRAAKAAPKRMSLDERLRLYRRAEPNSAEQVALEKELVSDSREAILAIVFNLPPPAPQSFEEIDDIASRLWKQPFIDYLDIQHQGLTTLSQRASAVALAALTPNALMRADLRRTLARHWPEGPKAICPPTSADCLAGEPGFITVLKSLVRENRPHSTQKPRVPKLTQKSDAPSDDESRPNSPDAAWCAFLQQLVRDYCRRCHAASLARAAAVYREGAAVTAENRTDSPLPPLPGCEVVAAHQFCWPGNGATDGTAAENEVSLRYQRFEKRMKSSKPLLNYRRQLDSCVERSMIDGIWLDGFRDRKNADHAQSVDVLITWPKTRDGKPSADEQELTVEVLCVEVRKSVE